MYKTDRKAKSPEAITFVTEYVHYRTGKLMKAKDYGYTVWPIGKRRKK